MSENENEIDSEQLQGSGRAFVIFVVVIFFIVSLSSFIFYSTMRSRSIGIATGYLKAVETFYQTSQYLLEKDLPNHSFETGIYKVDVETINKKDRSSPIIVKIKVKDKLFSVTHHSEELKLIPLIKNTEKRE